MARKLLLADDSITIQKVVELVLAEEGFEIKAVNNGEEALAAAATFKPDIVLADIEMPKMNGYQLCEKLKMNPSTKDIPVILLSGAFEPLDEELARQVKAYSFVIKPFESQELISKINASLISPAATAEAVVEEAVAVEAEEEAVVAEAVSGEEDLWSMEAMEDVPAEVAALEEVLAEAVPEEAGFPDVFAAAEPEEINIVEALEVAEEAELSAEAVFAQAVEATPVEAADAGKMAAPVYEEKIVSAPADLRRQREMPVIELPSKEELSAMFKKAVDERVASFLSTMDIKSELLSSITPALKDSIEKVLWEVAPELTEKLLKEILQSSLASLSKEIEKVIWETVPEVAERLIAKEIEKIKSEL